MENALACFGYLLFISKKSVDMKGLYLLIDFCTVIVPFLFSFHPKLQFYKQFKAFFLSCFTVGTLFVLWDVYFTSIGVWGFNSDYLIGIYLFNLPIEEVLFFVCVPFSCVYSYHCLNLFYDFNMEQKTEQRVVAILSSLLLFVGIVYYDRLYTSVTFISLALLLVYFSFMRRTSWLGRLMNIYLFLLLPFFIVNGILTGTGLEAPIVWYNNHENLAIRLLTIPIEDAFYGFALILLNVFFYEKWK
jgi:lycopene cyclase domain-containing protein